MRNEIDIHVGRRVRQRRWMTGATQQEVANQIGITFQQLQKYESGTNRISASRLWAIAEALEVPVSYFFEGLGRDPDAAQDTLTDFSNDREALVILKALYAVPGLQRQALLSLANSIGSMTAFDLNGIDGLELKPANGSPIHTDR